MELNRIKELNPRKIIRNMTALQLIEVLWIIVISIDVACSLIMHVGGAKPTNLEMFIQISSIITTILCFSKIAFVDDHKITEWLVFAALVVLCLVNRNLTQNSRLFCILIAAFSAYGISYSKLAKGYLFAGISVLLYSFYQMFSGKTDDRPWYRHGDETNELIRHTFGFAHSNGFGTCCMVIVLAGLILIYRKRSKLLYLFLLIFTVAFMYLSGSRTSGLVCIFAITTCLVADSLDSVIKNNKLLAYLSCIIVAIVPIFFIMLSFNYSPDNGLSEFFNQLFTGRVNLSNVALSSCGITLWGQTYQYDGYIDSLFIQFLVGYGIVPLVLWVATMCTVTYRSARNNRWDITIICVGTIMYCMLENSLITLMNMAIMAACSDIYERQSNNTTKEQYQ